MASPALHPPAHRGWTIAALVALGVLLAALLTRELGNPSLGYPDADRILMDGVFIHDFLRDLEITNVYGYTKNYYGQYPALSIGYRPPFFPFVEALFNSVFGVNVWSSRLAILALAFVGFGAWFALVRRVFDLPTAFASCALLASLPFVAKWGWYTMAELPLMSMAMLTLYLFHRYAETNSTRMLLASAIAFSLTVWTKQSAFYLAFVLIAWLALERELVPRLKLWRTWGAIALVLTALVPLAAITIWLGDQNFAQSIGTSSPGGPSTWMRRVMGIPKLLGNVARFQTTLPFLGLMCAGLALSVLLRERRTVYFWLVVLCTFLFFTYVIHKNERYTIFWLPSFALFAAYPLFVLRERAVPRLAFGALLAAVVAWQITQVYARPPNYATGYDEAARFVLDNSSSPTVLVDAHNNGYFTYFMRALDDSRSMYVLRGDKLLSSSSISTSIRAEVHVRSREGILGLLDEYGVELIVVESKDRIGLPIHKELRAFLAEGPPFTLLARIPVESTRTPLQGLELLVYRYDEHKPPAGGVLTLRLPVVGQTIRVPIRHRELRKP